MTLRRTDQLELFGEVIESVRQRDEPFVDPDGAWGTRRVRPGGPGWRILHDRERLTVWQRRQAITWRSPMHGWWERRR